MQQTPKCKRFAVLQLRESDLSALHTLCGQADDKTDVVLQNVSR